MQNLVNLLPYNDWKMPEKCGVEGDHFRSYNDKKHSGWVGVDQEAMWQGQTIPKAADKKSFGAG